MSECMGTCSVGAKVDEEMRRFIEEEAEKRAVTKCELLRRILDVVKQSIEEETNCATCGAEMNLGEVL